jgi:hypothetical protein
LSITKKEKGVFIMNENRKTFDHDVLWNEVRERVLDCDLACVSSMLALSDEGDYKFIFERETVLRDIAVLNYYIEKDDEDNIVKAYEQFKLDLQSVLSEHCSSKLPEAEACAIALAWLSILQD